MASLASQFDVGLFDLDGVCYLGPRAIPYAPESISAAVAQGLRQAYVTNNASRRPADVAAHLSSLGIPATTESVITSASVACEMLSRLLPDGAAVLVIGTDALREEVLAAHMRIAESSQEHPAAVLHGFTPDLNWEWMSEAALAIRAGAVYFATNLDLTIPRDRGLMVGNGAMVEAIALSTGVEPLSAGKPKPEIFSIAAPRVHAQKPLAIGDNLSTDIQGAVAAGVPSLHVLTGLATARDVCLAAPVQRPTYLGDDLRSLNEPYPEMYRDGDWVVCAGERVRWTGVRYEAADGWLTDHLSLDLYRAVARLSWALSDEGVPAHDLAETLPEFTVMPR